MMAETIGQPERQKHHKELIGTVVSNKMQKTIVVEVTRKKAHPMYKRVIAIRKKLPETVPYKQPVALQQRVGKSIHFFPNFGTGQDRARQ